MSIYNLKHNKITQELPRKNWPNLLLSTKNLILKYNGDLYVETLSQRLQKCTRIMEINIGNSHNYIFIMLFKYKDVVYVRNYLK